MVSYFLYKGLLKDEDDDVFIVPSHKCIWEQLIFCKKCMSHILL